MPYWRNSTGLLRLLLGLAGICYPFAVYAAMGQVPAGAFILVALALLVLRLAVVRGHALARLMLGPLLATMAATLALALLAPDLAVKAYPILMSLCFAAAFGISLLRPPSLIEILARRREPDLAEPGIRYTRRLSLIWFGFLILNASLSLATALYGNMELWTLYNGAISYLLAAALLGGEMLLRRRIRARPAS